MSYFGGLGAGKGWHTFLFALTVDELDRVLRSRDLFVVITNARVPADYSCTPLDEFLRAYEDYLAAMPTEVEIPRKLAGEIHTSLAASLAIFNPKPCPDTAYKIMNPTEPVVNLAPVPVSYHNDKLSTATMSKVSLGIEMTFPKFVSFERDDFETLHPTEPFDNHRLFTDLRSCITGMTGPCVIRSPARRHRTRIRVTPAMREQLKNQAGLASLGLSVE